MIILDTNVVSEPAKPSPNRAVVDWLDRQTTETLYLASPVLAELLSGVEALPPGRRRDGLSVHIETLIHRLFGSRILSFDEAAARLYAPLMRRARSEGKTVSLGDGQIAAIAAAHGFTVATRDVAPFRAVGIPVLNPWHV